MRGVVALSSVMVISTVLCEEGLGAGRPSMPMQAHASTPTERQLITASASMTTAVVLVRRPLGPLMPLQTCTGKMLKSFTKDYQCASHGMCNQHGKQPVMPQTWGERQQQQWRTESQRQGSCRCQQGA